MYQPKKYKKKDPDFIFEFIKAHPFATFVINGDKILATHIPVLAKGNSKEFILYSHIANHNEQYKFLKDNKEALLIFQGPHSYVSSSWYKEKNISTWDYSAVHINVELKIQSREELVDSLKELVFEFERNQEHPLFFEDLAKDMVEDHLPQITGFWCKPVRMQAIAKLHQGFEKYDIESIAGHLEKKDDPLSCPLSKDILKENS